MDRRRGERLAMAWFQRDASDQRVSLRRRDRRRRLFADHLSMPIHARSGGSAPGT
jgi:hypothetical protein